MSEGNTKLLKAAKQFCEAHADCELCPLHSKFCINDVGEVCMLDDKTTLTEFYTALYHIACFVDDCDFMK